MTGTASDAHDKARETAAQAQEGAYAAKDKASDVYNQVMIRVNELQICLTHSIPYTYGIPGTCWASELPPARLLLLQASLQYCWPPNMAGHVVTGWRCCGLCQGHC